ncbi:hypothetical protein [Pedobacter frigiditerrae]|uniref:NACHT domain-containing protein n=1 Tax=Pedobacter frigiditerrae TaxID=2530452 RepID=UPI00292F2C6F|nr:hypothetical protein [Pedobacter frigiditerrae]
MTWLSAYSWLLNESNLIIKSVSLPAILIALYKGIQWLYRKVRDADEKKNLSPYYSLQTIKYSKKNYIRTKCQNVDPANEINYKSSFAFSTKEDLLTFFLRKVFNINKNETKFYLILADSGMGKSTFMLNLFSRYSSFLNFLIKKNQIKLYPLGENYAILAERIKDIVNKENTILLLDGFDEIPTADNLSIKSKFDEIINLVKDFKTVIITCRTHFFSSESEEPFELKVKMYNTKGNGYHHIKKLYISPFDDNDIKKYIRHCFKFYEFKKKKTAMQIIDGTGDLMVRPMLLSYIIDLTETSRHKLQSKFEIYETLINAWVDRESKKYELSKRYEFKENLIYFTYSIVDYIYNHYEKNGLYIPLEDAVKIANQFQINLDDIEIKSKSLLNRNSAGNYKFSHKSIYEFFIAFLSYMNRSFNGTKYSINYNLESYDEAKNFLEEIFILNKTEFILPLVKERKDGYNVKLYAEIMKMKNHKIFINWQSGSSFSIEKQDSKTKEY